jgi:aspartyl/asparaginyl beta-hydroxylase (cupin superfamily)
MFPSPEAEMEYLALKDKYGASALKRVDKLLTCQGKRDPFQQGAKFVMPDLSCKPWHNPYEYHELGNVVRKLESLHPRIKEEILSVMGRADSLTEYDHYLKPQKNWKALYLYKKEGPVKENFALCPVTSEFLMGDLLPWLCPLLEMHFSILEPGTHIPPHNDLWNFSLNLHLAVVIPDRCRIRVGSENRSWDEGKCLLFDYSYEHEAWNESNERRVCLLADVWNPGLTIPEREGIVILINAIRKLLYDE